MDRISVARHFTSVGGLRGMVSRMALALAIRRDVEGIPVYFDPDCEDVDRLASRIAAALQLVQATAARRWRRVVRDLSRLQCTNLGAPGAHYAHSIAACVLDADYVRQWPAATIAATIIHEATHARIERAGITYRPEQRQRIERRCVLESIEFVEALPGDHANLLAHLSAATDRVWYSNQQLMERAIARYRALGAPHWLIKWFRQRAERRERRTSRPAA